MTYTLCKRQIEVGKTEGMQEKLDVFLLNNRITLAQYEELVAMMPPVTEQA